MFMFFIQNAQNTLPRRVVTTDLSLYCSFTTNSSPHSPTQGARSDTITLGKEAKE
jgi:hypothetical protein